MRKDSWFRGSLLSVLFFAVAAVPIVAQTSQVPADSVDRGGLVKNLLDQIEAAYRDNDTRFLKNLAAMAYAGGPLDDVKDAEMPPVSSQELPGYLADRVLQLETDSLKLLAIGANQVRRDPARAVAVGWWSCASSYIRELSRCWDIYFDCMDPEPHGPGGAPDQQWCNELFDACMANASESFDDCMNDDDALPY